MTKGLKDLKGSMAGGAGEGKPRSVAAALKRASTLYFGRPGLAYAQMPSPTMAMEIEFSVLIP